MRGLYSGLITSFTASTYQTAGQIVLGLHVGTLLKVNAAAGLVRSYFFLGLLLSTVAFGSKDVCVYNCYMEFGLRARSISSLSPPLHPRCLSALLYPPLHSPVSATPLCPLTSPFSPFPNPFRSTAAAFAFVDTFAGSIRAHA